MGKASQTLAIAIMAFTLASGVTVEVRAQGMVRDLLAQCEGDLKVYCAGYIAGLYEGVATDHLLDEKLDFCLPARRGTGRSSISYPQMIEIFVDWAKTNPSGSGGINRWMGVRQALSDAFPCEPPGPAVRAKPAESAEPDQSDESAQPEKAVE